MREKETERNRKKKKKERERKLRKQNRCNKIYRVFTWSVLGAQKEIEKKIGAKKRVVKKKSTKIVRHIFFLCRKLEIFFFFYQNPIISNLKSVLFSQIRFLIIF